MVRTTGLVNYSNVHFTNKDVARRVVEYFRPTLPCLEPCAGDGAFLSALPPGTEWCEIERDIDFFDYQGRVEWIVTNPPFGDLTEWMAKAFSVSRNVVFLMPLSNLYSSVPRMELVRAYGGVKTVLYLGSGRGIGFDIGFPFGAIHFQEAYSGPAEWVWELPNAIKGMCG